MTTIYDEAKKRIPTQKEMILKALKDAGSAGVLNSKLQKISLRYGGILGFLYKEGYKIDTINLGDGAVKYVFKSDPTPDTKLNLPKAKELLMSKINNIFGGQVTAEQLENLLVDEGISMRYVGGTFK
jgi:hypothetical protein